MKKLFTLVALLASFMGAKAEWVEDYKIDYSTHTGFPFYVMGYVPEWVDGVMTDYGSTYRYATQDVLDNGDSNGDGKLTEAESIEGTVTTEGGAEYQKVTGANPYWHQYFIADGIPTEMGDSYTVKAMVKASEACTINVNMGWGWGNGQQMGASVAIGTEWAEVEWTYTEIGGSSCNLVAQPGTVQATIEWKWVTVSHNAKQQAPTEWIQHLTNGDAETAWPAWSLETEDGINANWRGDRTGEICAWALTMGRNYDDQNTVINEDSPRARPYPADIEAEAGNESNHVFAVHVTQVDKIDDDNSIQWSNQFWIQSPQGWKSGTQVRVKFRYKADYACKAATQIHKKNPSDYLHWEAVGDVNFTTQWQDYEKTFTFSDSQANGWSIAFNLNAESTVDNPQAPNVFYFDDLSWETMKLDEGLFVASSNSSTGLEYDYANATPFEWDEDNEAYVATVGTEGDQSSWVKEVMISTIRGNDAAFKGATIKPAGTVVSEEWLDYTEASLAKIKLPEAGVWNIYVDTNEHTMMFEKIEGEKPHEPVVINPNPSELVINTVEREPTSSEQPGDEEAGISAGTGQPWDNQFWIVANRTLDAGETTVVQFKYRSKIDAKVSTQSHANPGAYLHWAAIGEVNFVGGEDWLDFETTFTVASEANGMQSIAFNLSEIKEANTYEIKDVVWKLEDGSESLINQTGTENFYVKILGGNPVPYGTEPGPKDPIQGDANKDGKVDIADITQIISVIAANGYDAAADANNDNFVDVADITQVISIMAAQSARAEKAIEE